MIRSYARSYARVAASFLLVAFGVGCSVNMVAPVKKSSNVSMSGTCDEILFEHYKAEVYPFFRSPSTCVSCHIEGGQGLGTFASADQKVAFAAFNAAGVSKVSYMATNPQHKPPYTGDQNKPAVNAWSSVWVTHQSEYFDCVSKSQNGGVNESLLTSAKGASDIYASPTAMQTLSWDLDLAEDLDVSVSRSVPARISIDVRVLYQNNKAQGYIFSNPRMILKDVTKQVIVEGLFFHINRVPISNQTTFTNLSRIVSGPAELPLMTAQANTLIQPVSSQDVFQLYLQRIAPTSGTDGGTVPLTPVLRISDTTTGSTTLIKSETVNVNIVRDAGILRWCLSESPAKPASANAPCLSGATGDGTLNGWFLSRPSSFTFSSGDGIKQLYLWVADQNLGMNDQPAVVDATLDTTAPLPASIGSITVTDTQVAAMSVTHPNEGDVYGWCVIEQNSIKAAPARPALDNTCWRWTDASSKPTTVGFKEGGARNVWVFVRDQAGNVSSASNVFAATNPFGAVTFTQLTSSAGGPRAIFYNRCFTCHGSSANPGYSKLQLFNYEEAKDVADNGVLVSRINNPISPMPNVNGALMPQRDRDLIRLWTLPEEGNVPLP